MCHTSNEKWKTTNKGKNRTTKSRKNQNAQRTGKLKILGNAGSGDERKKLEKNISGEREIYSKPIKRKST